MDTELSVPTIDVRESIPDHVIARLVKLIINEFHPKKIILFGSYAYGTPGPESDIDLLIIMDTSLRPIDQVQKIRKFIDPLFGLDIILYRPGELEKRLTWGDTFLQEIITKGKVLYESPDA